MPIVNIEKYYKKDKLDRHDHSSLYWLTSIPTDKSDLRHHITTIRIESGVATKTNGSILFSACLQREIEDGDYTILKRTKSEIIIERKTSLEDGNWPDWSQLFNKFDSNIFKDDKSFYCLIDDEGIIGKKVGLFYVRLFESIKDKDQYPLFNTHYIEHALSGFSCDFYFHYIDKDSPIYFIDPNLDKIAAIMPMRI